MTFLLLLGMLLACTCQPGQRPDVVLVIIDTLRGDRVSYTGYERPTTPRLDAFAGRHTWYARAFSASCWTLPSTASILTGVLPPRHGAIRQGDHFGRLREDVETLAERFRARGYRTGAFVNNAFLAPEFHLQRGFDVYDYEGAGLVDHRTFAQTVDKALGWLEASDQPAFLLVHAMEPHADYQPSPENLGRFSGSLPHTMKAPLGGPTITRMINGELVPGPEDQAWISALYDEEVRTVDDALGTLLDALARRPGHDRMRLAITSDHGEEFWDYGGYEHGHNLLSPSLHVPLVLQGPGLPAGRVDAPVTTVDVYDFLLDGDGPLVEAARGGRPHEALFAEDLLYARQQATAFDEQVKATIFLGTRTIRAWRLADSLREAGEIEAPQKDPHVVDLLHRLEEARGGFDLPDMGENVVIPGYDAFQKLRALGYVE